MKLRIAGFIIQLIISSAGVALVWYYSNWQVLVGVLLMMWMNNLDYKRERG